MKYSHKGLGCNAHRLGRLQGWREAVLALQGSSRGPCRRGPSARAAWPLHGLPYGLRQGLDTGLEAPTACLSQAARLASGGLRHVGGAGGRVPMALVCGHEARGVQDGVQGHLRSRCAQGQAVGDSAPLAGSPPACIQRQISIDSMAVRHAYLPNSLHQELHRKGKGD